MELPATAVGPIAPGDTYRPSEPAGPSATLAPPLLLQYWQVVQRWRWVILAIIGAALLAGVIVTMLMTPLYTATSRIEVSRDEGNVTKVEGVESPEFGRSLEFYQTQYSLLQARSLAERVARELRLSRDERFFAAIGMPLDDSADLLAANRTDQAVGALLAGIKVVPVRGSSLVDVSFTSADPGISARIANAWADQFIKANLARRFAATADARKFLEERLADLRIRLEQSESQQIDYASRQGIIAIERTEVDGRTTSQRTLAAADLQALNDELARATAERIAAEAESRSGSVDGAAAAMVTSATGPMRQRRAELAAEYARLLVQFDPKYPAAQAVADQIRALDTAISREEARNRSSSAQVRSGRYAQAVERERQLRARVEQLKATLDQQQRAGVQNNIFQRDVDTNRQLYDALLQRYKEIGVAGVATNNISVVDAAEVPTSPSQPRLGLNLAFALLAGLGIAVLAVLALNQMDEGLRNPTEVSGKLGIPLLGSVPNVEDGTSLDLIADVKSELSEAYLSILSNLAFSTDHGLPRSIMVTSTRPAEGKSTSALAIAAMIGRSERSTILIDSDMRSPSGHEFLGLGNERGLSNFLAGDDDWRKLIQPTRFKGLSLLSAGPQPPSAAELLSSQRFGQLIEQLGSAFDHIVIDAPPILGLADAPLLSRLVEGCVFVIEAKGVSVRGVRASLDRLRAVNAHILGGVLTKLEHRDAAFGYGYGYGYGSGYGYGGAEKEAPPAS